MISAPRFGADHSVGCALAPIEPSDVQHNATHYLYNTDQVIDNVQYQRHVWNSTSKQGSGTRH